MAESKFSRVELELSASNVMRKLRMPALGLGAVGLLASAGGAMVMPKTFFQAWLVAYFYWLAMALGSTALLMMQYISGGRWGAAIRRPLEAGASNVPLMALFFIPVALGMHELYPWADPARVAASHVLTLRAPYLNPTMAVGRAILFFGIWSFTANRLVAWSRQSDSQGWTKEIAGKIAVMSHMGVIAWVISMSLFAIDWAMTLEEMWFSHIYGLMFTGAQILTALMLAVQVSARIADHRPVSSILSPSRFYDLGKLMLAFTMVWTYFQLSQFLIMWGANLPEEVEWYLVRNMNGWDKFTMFLFLFHFVVPFALLLSRKRKKKPMQIAAVAAWMCFMRYVDIYWWITPEFSKSLWVHPLHLATMLGIGGVWMWRYVGTLQSHPILAVHEPVIATELEHA